MSEIALALNHVSVAYSGSPHPVLNNFSMTVRRGEIACLLGASGCGKTTALRAIAGFEYLSGGEIYLTQRCVAGPGVHLPPEKRHVGMVFQDYALFPHLTAGQNIAFGLRQQPRDVQQARVDKLLALVELHQHAGRYPHELSGGQQQRIALARAMAPEPDILLLDEPFSSLDRPTRERLSGEVREILRQAGQTALLVTHSEWEAEAIASRIGYVENGTYRSHTRSNR